MILYRFYLDFNGLYVKFTFPALQLPHGALDKQIQYEVHFQELSITNRIHIIVMSIRRVQTKNIYTGYFEIVVAAQLQGCRKIFQFGGDKV